MLYWKALVYRYVAVDNLSQLQTMYRIFLEEYALINEHAKIFEE